MNPTSTAHALAHRLLALCLVVAAAALAIHATPSAAQGKPHNLPLVGWPMLRGRCYDCRTPIPIRYWLWELGFAALFVAAGIATPWL